MIDALGRPQSVLLLGGTSEIGLAVLRALPREQLQRVVLLGRDRDALTCAAATMSQATPSIPSPTEGASTDPHGGRDAKTAVEVVVCDAADTDAHGAIIDAVFDAGDIDVTILAIGELGDQQAAQADPRRAVTTLTSTFTGPASLLLHTGRRLEAQGHGTVVVLSSVAGLQARKSNFVYGSAKGGLDLMARGLMDSLHGSGARVLLVRPGFVRTRMTAGMPVPPLAVDAEVVAEAVVSGLRGRRSIIYAPAAARVLAAALTVAPRKLLRQMKF